MLFLINKKPAVTAKVQISFAVTVILFKSHYSGKFIFKIAHNIFIIGTNNLIRQILNFTAGV